MYVILVYDVCEKRVGKALKLCRQYLFHIQNSVFEGEVSEANLTELKIRLQELVEDTDSVVIFQLESLNPKFISKEIIGVEKRGTDNII